MAEAVPRRGGRRSARPPEPMSRLVADASRVARVARLSSNGMPDDSRNFSRVVRPDGALAMTVATGDEYTGRKPEPGVPGPSTKYPKGTETDLAIVVNVQLSLWDRPHERPDTFRRPARGAPDLVAAER